MSAAVLREVRLYGALGREFGRVFRLAVKTPAEAAQALCAVLPGFRRAFLGADGRAAYHVFVGRRPRRDIGPEQSREPVGATEPIRFVPLVTGAKRGGLLQIIEEAVLVTIGVFTGMPTLTTIGTAMILGGVIQLLSPQRKRDDSEARVSYAYDGPVNSVEQGGPVPCVFGRVICGSVVVSQGLSSDDLVAPASAPLTPVSVPAYEDPAPVVSLPYESYGQ